jgi:DNA repair protein RadA/Sms
MSKLQTQFVCQECGRVSATLLGKCPQCGAWNSMIEEVISLPEESKKSAGRGFNIPSQPIKLKDISSDVAERFPLEMNEFARVLGGGIVPGSIILIGGDPGIGKSTLLLQVALEMASKGRVLYVSGEESERQIKMRAIRLKNKNGETAKIEFPDTLFLVTETSLDVILQHVETIRPAVLIIDSIQTTYQPGLVSSAGSVSQVRECAARLREMAKQSGIAVFLIGHVTKEGIIAGPRVLEHIVDTVLQLEGDRFQSYRLLRSVKNRFGPTSEVGVFEMREQGMVEVLNPSEVFLAERLAEAPGSAITVTMEGTRPLLVELQALTSPTHFGNARRTANGLDFNRLLLVIAVLTRRMALSLMDQDVFANVVGGLMIDEPSADLAIAAAITSSYRDIPVKADVVLIGEVGLSGELRWVSQMPARLNEAAKLGFKTAIIPRRRNQNEKLPGGIKLQEARSIREALGFALLPPVTENRKKEHENEITKPQQVA